MGRLIKILWHLSALVGIATIAGAAWFWSQGLSARRPPGTTEIAVARTVRGLMIPSSDRARQNPVPATAENIRAGLEHWADHCASCHGNDGSGATEIGQGLFPRAPDMRRPDTQELTDGELFSIIENGVKLTGMPAWGTRTADGETASWHLVHFVRKLPSLSEAELEEMAALNPRTPAEWRTLEGERQFLTGEPSQPPEPAKSHVHKPDGK